MTECLQCDNTVEPEVFFCSQSCEDEHNYEGYTPTSDQEWFYWAENESEARRKGEEE
jgi:hypothetical protein